jgi:hypothetical protein
MTAAIHQAARHDADNHGRLLRALAENDPTFKDYKVVEASESESGNKLTLVLVKKDVQGEGFVMTGAPME